MIIDAHTHYWDERHYPDGLLAEYDRLGIDMGCISGLGALFGLGDNGDVEEAFRRHPDRLVGFGYIRLGRDDAALVDELFNRGFKGLKFTCPLENYDHKAYYPIYARAEELGMPALFHSGIVTTREKGRRWDISSARMRPVFLDTIAHAFPSLHIICAHMGVPWYDEATTMARILDNIYVDITGAPQGWRLQKDVAFFQELFYWEGAYDKVLWGTDVHYRDMAATLARDRKLFRDLGLSEEQTENVLGRMMARLLSL